VHAAFRFGEAVGRERRLMGRMPTEALQLSASELRKVAGEQVFMVDGNRKDSDPEYAARR
jgi:hypothetical protein